MNRRTLLKSSAVLPLVASPLRAFSQEPFPSRPVRLIVGFGAGGGMDIMYRNVAQRLTPLLGQNVLVENRPGANGSVSAIYVASQVPADGHTLLVLPSFMATINPHLYKDATVDYDRDFVNVGGVTDTRFVVMVPSSLGITTLKQFVDEARAKPGTFNFASGGNGSIAHLVFERFRTEQRLEIEHVPYKGTGPAVPDFLAGRIHLMIDNYNQLKAHVERGAVKVLAVANTERMKAIPDVPTTAEAGFPNLLAIGWSSLMAPAKVPEAALARLRKAVRRVAEDPDFAEYMESIGAAARWREPEELLQLTRREREFWGAFIRNHGIQVT